MSFFSLLRKLFNLFNFRSKTQQTIEERVLLLGKFLPAKITNTQLFVEAITHQSSLNNHKLKASNQRLEFLGDAVLGMIVANYLYEEYPDLNEGELTKMRVRLVDKNALFEMAINLDLEKIVLFEKKFLQSNSSGINSILADAMEAIIGACYLDLGIENTIEFVHNWLIDVIDYSKDSNFKGQLLELAHKMGKTNPEYEIVNVDGPEHKKIFIVAVLLDGAKLAVGRGKNKKSAEQEASKRALEILSENL
jgi:ribonuclease-3